MEFDEFTRTAVRRLRAGLIAAYGLQVGLESAAVALAYGWEHRDRLSQMNNPAGHLYRVGQTTRCSSSAVVPVGNVVVVASLRRWMVAS